MKRIFGCLAIFILVPVLALTILGLILPRDWTVERSITVKAPMAEVHAMVSDFRKWADWRRWKSPGSDVETELTFSGNDRQVGSELHWNSSDDLIGKGHFLLTETAPSSGIHFDVFIESQGLEGKGAILYKAVDGGTLVMWKDEGELHPVIGGLLSWIFKAGHGARLEDDLARLKRMLEGTEKLEEAVTPRGG